MKRARLAIASNILYELLFKENYEIDRENRQSLVCAWTIISELESRESIKELDKRLEELEAK